MPMLVLTLALHGISIFLDVIDGNPTLFSQQNAAVDV